MFGILYMVCAAIGKAIGEGQKQFETSQNKKEAKKKGSETYYDWHGAERLIKNGKYVKRHTLDYGPSSDYVMEDENGNIIHNYSQNQRDKRKRQNIALARLNGNSVYEKERSDNDRNNLKQQRTIYVDLKTGEKLFCQSFNLNTYYRSVYDGRYVRRADCDVIRAKKNNEEVHLYEGVLELNGKWFKEPPEIRKQILENEMKDWCGSDHSVPSPLTINNSIWIQDYLTKDVEEFRKLLREMEYEND